MTLTNEELRRIQAVLDASTNSFVELCRIAGLRPDRDFRGADLRNVNFGTDDLSGYDFSGADLTDADLSKARSLDCVIFNTATSWPATHRHFPSGFTWEKVYRLIIGGRKLPPAWRPFVTDLCLRDEKIESLKPLAVLTDLQRLDIRGTHINDLTPLAALTNLTSIDLQDTLVSDISPLSGLINLTYVDLRGTQVIDVSPLAGLPNLQFVDLQDMPVTDISSLERHAKWTKLDERIIVRND